MARLTKLDDLIADLEQNKVPHRVEREALTVELPIAQPANAGSVVVRFERDLPYVQVIYGFLGTVPEARFAAIESAICIVNNRIKLPGFGFDRESRVVYMRLCVQLYEDGVTTVAFQRQILAALENAREFAAAFRDVVGGAPAEKVIELAIQHAQAGGKAGG